MQINWTKKLPYKLILLRKINFCVVTNYLMFFLAQITLYMLPGDMKKPLGMVEEEVS